MPAPDPIPQGATREEIRDAAIVIAANLDAKIDALDAKMDTLDSHLDAIEAKIDVL